LVIDQIAEPVHLRQYEQLLAQSFPIPPGASFYDDFPVWDPRFRVASLLRAGVIADGRVVAGASARTARLRLNPTTVVDVVFIGGVCCAPEFCGKGYVL
jgi:hypothetical protein